MHARHDLTEQEAEELEYKIDNEGLEYAVENYSSIVGADCQQFHSLVRLFLEHRDALNDYLSEQGIEGGF